MIPVTDKPKICTVRDCHPKKWSEADAYIWCPTCGNARCKKHCGIPTGLRCCTDGPRAAPSEEAP